MKVLYLAEWYPHRYDAMSGLFVRKHAAAAVRAGADICVLYFLHDEKISGIETVDQTTDNVRELYVYYNGPVIQAMKAGWQMVQSHWGMPQLTQLNVLTKNGLLAYWLNKRYHIPYIIIEHWSGYLPENNSFRGGLHGQLMKLIARNASCILPVSEALETAMKSRGIRCKQWERIHNVVDDFFFEEKEREIDGKATDGKFRFLHVSCFDERSKNLQGILKAIKQLSEERSDFEFQIIGTGPDFSAAKETADCLGLTGKIVRFAGEKTPREVHEAMCQSDCFVLFSRYETAGVVLAECLASGLPMIGTRAGAIPEIISEANGMLVESENVGQLAEAMSRMICQADKYDREAIRRMGKPYCEEAVGQKLLEQYRKYKRQDNRKSTPLLQ